MPEHATPVPPEDVGKEPRDIVGRNLTTRCHEIITLQQICPEREGSHSPDGSPGSWREPPGVRLAYSLALWTAMAVVTFHL
jgi:hypothetical protein